MIAATEKLNSSSSSSSIAAACEQMQWKVKLRVVRICFVTDYSIRPRHTVPTVHLARPTFRIAGVQEHDTT